MDVGVGGREELGEGGGGGVEVAEMLEGRFGAEGIGEVGRWYFGADYWGTGGRAGAALGDGGEAAGLWWPGAAAGRLKVLHG